MDSLSKIVLSFNGQPWEFENFVLQNTLHKDSEYFRILWKEALAFKNWNYSDLSRGVSTTIELLRERFGVDGDTAQIIANAASYYWK